LARKVYLHVGLPKTGTTYLQQILWANREELRAQRMLLPGDSGREHLWASVVVREDPAIVKRPRRATKSWDKLVAEVNAWPDTALITHEFFGGASREQARAAMAALGDAECHVVVTVRDLLGLLTARWQELIKAGSTVQIDDYPSSDETNPHDEWDWGSMDVGEVTDRWGADLPDERVHVVVVPPAGSPRGELWARFAGVVGLDPKRCESTDAPQNEGLGVAEVELLRRVNADLVGFDTPVSRGSWIRTYLAQGKLVPRQGEKFWPSPARVEEVRERSRHAVERLRSHEYDVVGDLEQLLVPDEVAPRRHPGSVTDVELVPVATATIAAMLSDLREQKQLLRRAERALAERESDQDTGQDTGEH